MKYRIIYKKHDVQPVEISAGAVKKLDSGNYQITTCSGVMDHNYVISGEYIEDIIPAEGVKI